MPISTEKKRRYPKDWDAIRQLVLERAHNRCEGSSPYPECRARNGGVNPRTESRVILTVAHIYDSAPENCELDNLRALCQSCHLTYDSLLRQNVRPPLIKIQGTRGPWGWMGNFAPVSCEYRDHVYQTGEHLFQSLRFNRKDPIQGLFRSPAQKWSSPKKIKELAYKNIEKMRLEPRDAVDLGNMTRVILCKLRRNPRLIGALMETRDCRIVEIDRRQEVPFWGVREGDDGWIGKDWLGRLWMEVRRKIYRTKEGPWRVHGSDSWGR